MPWLLFAGGLLLALMTLPGLIAVNHWAVLFQAFVLSWMGTAMTGWWLSLVTILTVVAIALGALASWPGWVGLGLVAASMAAMVRQALLARRAAAEFDRVLAERVATRLRSRRSPRSVFLPFAMRDVEVERVKDVRYADGAGRRHLLDVYRPRVAIEHAPVVLQLHGGGWTIGTKDTQGRPLMNRLARAGWVCVAANYRLSPRVHWPEHLVDAKRALAWIRHNIEEHGGDPSRVVVTGGSAGGHIAAMLALTAHEPRYQPGFEDVDTSVSAAIPMYAPYDLTEVYGRFGSGVGSRLASRFGAGVVGVTPAEDPDAYVDASPITHVHAGVPPFLVVHGTIDNLVPVTQARRFVAALRDAGTDVTYVELPGAPHAFDVFHSPWEHASTTGIEWWLTSVIPSPAADRETRAGSASSARARSEAGGPAGNGRTTTGRTAPSSVPRARAAPRRS